MNNIEEIHLVVTFLLENILEFHKMLEFSELPMEEGLRDKSLLESAIGAPFQTFAGEDLYLTLQEKAARLCFGIATNHPFVDGNKRTAVHAMELFLILNNFPIRYDDDEMERVVIDVANDKMDVKALTQWIQQHPAS